MSSGNFYSFLSRMKYINRWGLMRNTRYETLQEHSMEVAVIAHALANIDRVKFVPDPNGGPDILTVYGPTTTPQPLPSAKTE